MTNEKFTPSVTITLKEYQQLKEIEKGVQEKLIIYSSNGCAHYAIMNETELAKHLIKELMELSESLGNAKNELWRIEKILREKKIPY